MENLLKTGARWAANLSRRCKRRHRVTGLILFTLLATGFSFYLIATAFLPPKDYRLKIEPISLPGLFHKTGEISIDPLEKVRVLADSLRRHYGYGRDSTLSIVPRSKTN